LLAWLVNQPAAELMIELLGDRMLLRMAGWERYHALKRAETVSRTAFMAMKFGDEELNHVIDHCFRPAVTRAGFELRVLTDSQPAGSIDDQLRVALRISREPGVELPNGVGLYMAVFVESMTNCWTKASLAELQPTAAPRTAIAGTRYRNSQFFLGHMFASLPPMPT
jgi:hypothetical protein